MTSLTQFPSSPVHEEEPDIVFENRRKLRYIAFLFPMASGVIRWWPSMSGGHFGGLAIGDEFEWPPPWGPLGGKAHEIMPLSDVVIRNAKPREKPFKMGDSL